MFETPILLIVFNRLDTVERVYTEIKKQKPKELYVYCDAARLNKKGEKEEVEKVKNYIANNTDWNCNLKTFYPESNLGPGKGVCAAIKWFFDHVEKGIVLEHDCLPHPDFFGYCNELLNKYKDNPKVSFITGNSFTDRYKDHSVSYGFSALSHIWGWASWKRVIKDYHYDITLKDKEVLELIKKGSYFNSKELTNYVRYMALLHRNKKINTWDMQLLFTIWGQKGLCVFPKNNLVSNIGFGKNAVHCKDGNHPCANLPTYSILPLSHPSKIEIDYMNDLDYFNKYLKKNEFKYIINLLNYFIFKIKSYS